MSRSASPTSRSLTAVWLLSVLALLVGNTFEVFDLNHLFPSQRFLLVVLQGVFALWALIELVVLRRREKSIPLDSLIFALVVQAMIPALRIPIGRWLTETGLPARLTFGLAQIVIPLCAVMLLIVSKFLVDAFSFTERQRAEMLEHENQTRVRTEEALRSANAELQRLNATDSLTGVRTRGHFMQALAAETQRVRREGLLASLLLIDVDHFKMVNDTYGHPVGDAVLIELARRIRVNLRSDDVLARLGGEEFAVLLPQTEHARAVEVAEKLRAVIADEPFPVVGQVTASFGVAQWKPSDSLADWLQAADVGTYAAKSSGRNRVAATPLRSVR